MGKRLRSQRLGRGTPTYRSASHRFKAKIKYKSQEAMKGKIVDIIHDPGRTAPIARIKYDNGNEDYILHQRTSESGKKYTMEAQHP